MLQFEDKSKRLLLLSNSIQYGQSYLDHARDEIVDFLGDTKRILFIPFAMSDHAKYAQKNMMCFAAMEHGLESLHEVDDPHSAIERAEAFFIGGGNTLRLLKALYDRDLLRGIRARVADGIPYLGSSAGSVVACPTLKTTNDMPIAQPPSFSALGLISFQINAHYVDPEPGSTHMGQTREERLIEYLEDNDIPVLGLREGAMVRIEGGMVQLKGNAGARLFRRHFLPQEISPGSNLSVQ